MIQQGELLRYLQSRVVLEGLGLAPHLPDTTEQKPQLGRDTEVEK